MTARRIAGAFLALALAVGGATATRAQSISEMTADLQTLQAQIAAGDRTAYEAQAGRLKAIGAVIAAAKPEVWRSKRETDAAVAYLLSGGQPREIVQLLQSGAAPASETPLLRGALAYIVGDMADARRLLGDLDPRTLDIRLAGQVAFAQSVIAGTNDPKKAIAALDLARLLVPGSLVEEVALRREVTLVGDQHDADRFASLARQYATRFSHSVYADDFLHGLAAAVLKDELIHDAASFAKFDPFVAAAPPEIRRGFLLTIARAETLNGAYAVAGVAAGRSLQDAPSGSADEARGRLYEGAAKILTPDYDAGVDELKRVAPARLDRDDRALLGAVRDLAAYLREPPSEGASGSGRTQQGGDSDAAAAIALAEAAISRSEALVHAAGKGDL